MPAIGGFVPTSPQRRTTILQTPCASARERRPGVVLATPQRTPLATSFAPTPGSTGRQTVQYSNALTSTVDLSSLTASRFILQRQRQLPYRDEQGRVNLHLVMSSLALAKTADLPPDCDREEVVTRLERWARHAQRALQAQANCVPRKAEAQRETYASLSPSLTERPSARSRLPPTRRLFADVEGEQNEKLPLSLRKPRRGCTAVLKEPMNDALSPVKRKRSTFTDYSRILPPSKEMRHSMEPLSPVPARGITEDSTSSDDEVYQVEEILKESDRGFLIRWAGYSADHDSWEPEENVSLALIEDFRLAQAEALQYSESDFLRGTEKRLWCNKCQQHSHPDNFSQLMRTAPEARRTCLKHRCAPGANVTPVRSVASTTLTKERFARCQKFGLSSL